MLRARPRAAAARLLRHPRLRPRPRRCPWAAPRPGDAALRRRRQARAWRPARAAWRAAATPSWRAAEKATSLQTHTRAARASTSDHAVAARARSDPHAPFLLFGTPCTFRSTTSKRAAAPLGVGVGGVRPHACVRAYMQVQAQRRRGCLGSTGARRHAHSFSWFCVSGMRRAAAVAGGCARLRCVAGDPPGPGDALPTRLRRGSPPVHSQKAHGQHHGQAHAGAAAAVRVHANAKAEITCVAASTRARLSGACRCRLPRPARPAPSRCRCTRSPARSTRAAAGDAHTHVQRLRMRRCICKTSARLVVLPLHHGAARLRRVHGSVQAAASRCAAAAAAGVGSDRKGRRGRDATSDQRKRELTSAGGADRPAAAPRGASRVRSAPQPTHAAAGCGSARARDSRLRPRLGERSTRAAQKGALPTAVGRVLLPPATRCAARARARAWRCRGRGERLRIALRHAPKQRCDADAARFLRVPAAAALTCCAVWPPRGAQHTATMATGALAAILEKIGSHDKGARPRQGTAAAPVGCPRAKLSRRACVQRR